MNRLAVCLTLLWQPAWCLAEQPSAEKIQATIAYLQKLQTREGSFLPTADAREGTLRATSAALRALKYFGGSARDLESCKKFVASCFDRQEGGFRDRPGQGKVDVPTTAVGIMAVVALALDLKPYAEPVRNYLSRQARGFEEVRIAAAGLEAIKARPSSDDWLKLLQRMKNNDGTYGKGDDQARATGGATAAWLRLGGKLSAEEKSAIVKALKAGQQADGGYRKQDARQSDLETTYRVLRSFHMLGEVPDVARVRAFIARCRNADGGYGVSPGQSSSVSATYFAAVILHWLKAER